MKNPLPSDERVLLVLVLLGIGILIVLSQFVSADDEAPAPEEKTTLGTPTLFIACNRYSPMWKRVFAEFAREDWIVEQYNVVLEDIPNFREPMWRYSPHDVWRAWPKPAECKLSPFATSGMASIWIRPELEQYVAGRAWRYGWEPPCPVIPAIAPQDDHVAPVPPMPEDQQKN